MSLFYDDLLKHLQNLGAYLCKNEEKAKLQKLMWSDPENHIPSLDVIAKPATHHIAKLAGIALPDDCSLLIVEENGTGSGLPFSGEKLSPVLAL
jgi:sulfoacetaldehyde dehydrogenase